MTLPPDPRAAQLRSFGIVCSTGSTAALMLLAFGISLPDRHLWLPFAAIPGFAGVAAALVRPGAWRGAYEAWNRLANAIRKAVVFLLLAICYFLVLPTVGLAGSKLLFGRRGRVPTLWLPRGVQPGASYFEEAVVPPVARRRSGSGRHAVWCFRSGNLWALPILAMAGLLAAHHSGRGRAPANIYTLY